MAARRKFMSPDGDHLTLLNIYRAYKGFNGSKVAKRPSFINVSVMSELMQQTKN